MGKFAKRKEGKVVGKDAQDRPGWKGPGHVKKDGPAAKSKKEKMTEPKSEETEPEPTVPASLQQTLLNIFRDAFPELVASNDLQRVLQDVKGALYERDFNRAFGTDEYLEAYSLRWSPSRALGYTTMLVDIQEYLAPHLGLVEQSQDSADPTASKTVALHVICFGGGAAEVVAFGGFQKFLEDSISQKPKDTGLEDAVAKISITQQSKIKLYLVDSAAWQHVATKLNEGLSSLPILKYANSAAKEANRALLPAGEITTTFQKENVLDMSLPQVMEMIGGELKLLTLLFTLNELYTASIGKTTAFLLNLTLASKPGTLLLVADSPGSYSETTVGTEAKKYPMKFLMDHTLLAKEKSEAGDEDASWEKLVSDDSRWFRLPENLRYPIPLENMRYQIHLYRRV
ncbi:hypothetical protein BJ878DRAFT_102854 [Calycina marina]|uniref:25S rRNA (Uridine(2843)-N(3))-methyltransferase n=1 Tax=Calycina marina TaxID=1763456 RepID=A0A9P7Z1V9_9HELO|nr:hypothetical protein BJ878DRAFT_102854 [Calycina marina]